MKKGLTLIEVLVALAVFTISILAISSTYLLSVKAVNKQKEYLYFENVCLEIDAYSDAYGREWDQYYFKEFYNSNNEYYYDDNYKLVNTSDKYRLFYDYNQSNELILSIYNTSDRYFVIENLNYGGARYE